ncbi:MAG: acyl carrier protein [bacterium]|nr:acyl carrier protein [bacterium]MDZ4284641.1 acyl carrier protein [Patescibacteria group bacterium]
MEQKEIRERIKTIFQETFPEEAFRWEKKQEEFPRWDSLSHMELVGKCEERLGSRFEMEEVMALNTPEDFFRVISKKNGGPVTS